MEGSSKKFRLANLMVNLGTGELLKPCYITKCRIFKSELPCRLPSQGCVRYFSPCGINSPCGPFTPCGVYSPCGALKSLYEQEVVPCAAGSRITDYLDMYKHTPIIIEEIDDLEVIVELKNDLPGSSQSN